MQIAEPPDGCVNGGAVVGGIEGPQKLTLLADKSQLCCGGAGIDAEKSLSAVRGQIAGLYPVGIMTGAELRIVLLGSEQGLHALHLEFHLQGMGGLIQELGKKKRGFLAGQKSGSHRREEVRILHLDGVLFVQMELPYEGSLQLCEKVQGTAEEGHVAADRLSLRKAGNGLNDHGLENGGRQILLPRAVVDQGLDVGFGEHAAACGNGIKRIVMPRIFIEPGSICLQKRRHLVDEGAGAAGTGSVHALLDIAVLKINDLGILAAKLNGNIGQRGNSLDGGSLGHHLLYEGNFKMVGKRETAGTGDDGMNANVPLLTGNLLQNVMEGFTDLGVVPPVIPEEQLPVAVQQRSLYGGGSDINSESIVFRNHVACSCICYFLFKCRILLVHIATDYKTGWQQTQRRHSPQKLKNV